MKTTITCPKCHQEHGLFWTVHKDGDRTLNYRCNKVERQHQDKHAGRPELRTVTQVLTADVKDFPGIESAKLPEEWSAAYRKEQQNKNQHQFVLMYQK